MIHPTAIIDAKAELAADVEIGPYCVIGPDVRIDCGTVVHSHVVIKGPTKIGRNNEFFQFSSIGEACQDKKYKGEATGLEIGDDNVIREYVTLNRGTVQDRGMTTIGSRNLLMAYVHVGHDCILGDDIVFANNATVAGHVDVGDGVILGGFTGVHQFCKVGAYSMASMFSAINKDVPAFVMVRGNMAGAHGMNYEGMRRRGYSKELINKLRNAYKTVYRQSLSTSDAIDVLAPLEVEDEEMKLFVDSLRSSERGIVR